MSALAIILWALACIIVALVIYAFLNAAGSYDSLQEEIEAERAASLADYRREHR